ncbi:DUF871 family protein [Curtobacterium sp. VKM Ac-1393]|nr:DUF871 family protein [Curtobacterium sp. VKM Ac-1393]
MRLGASAYLAHAPLAGPTFEAAAAAGAKLAFASLHIPEDSADGARAAAAAIVSAATSSGLSVVADVSPNTARLLGDSPWEFLRSIGVARVRIDFGFPVAEIRSIASVLPIALNASTLRAADLALFADLDVELIHNFYPREWTGLALSSVAASVSVAWRFGWRVGAFVAGDFVRRGPLGGGCRPLISIGTRRHCSRRCRSSTPVWTTCTSGIRHSPITRGPASGHSSGMTSLCSTAPQPRACTRRSSRH